jgi:hypothetical protein
MRTLTQVAAAAVFFLCATTLFAQARLTGSVTDNTGGVLIGATVTATNIATGQSTSTLTTESGLYTIPLLNPGQYEVSCEAPGFKKFTRSGIGLETGTITTVNIEMSLGQITETVKVSAEAPLLETESGTIGQLIDNKNILNMPIQSLRSAALIRLMGNISFRSEDGGEAIPRFSMGGGRSLNQMWHLDGGVTQNMALGVAQLSLNPPNEALQEFKAIVNSYSAEFGRTGGGLILMTTRSGTNDFHGAAYEWLRNDALNTRTFFAPSKAPLRFNIFGASLGGPIVKNKTFFFYNYEGGRRRTGVTVTSNVPRPPEVNGDFSARSDIRILDPATRAGTTPATPFANNIIPASRIDPVGRAFAALYPAPNVPDDPTRAPSNNFRANTSDKLTQDFHTVRIDHEISENDRLSGRLSYVTAPTEQAAVFPVAEADPRAGINENRHANFIVTWQRTIRTNLINDFKYMYGNRMHINRGAGTGSGLNGQVKLQGVEATDMAQVTVAAHSALGQSPHLRIQQPILTHQITDGLLWLKGNHAVKGGFEFRYTANTDDFRQTSGGSFGFTERATNSAIASLLLGWTNNASLFVTDILETRTDYYGVYIQDDWKITPRFTLNIGLRWDLDTPRWEKNNRQSGFDLTKINPVSGTPGVITFAGMDGVSKYSHDFDKNNFGPRFGFAWRILSKTVVRGGYGISYNGPYQGAVPNAWAQGFSLSGSFDSPDGGFTSAFPLRNGMPAIAREPLGPSYGAVRVGDRIRTSPDFVESDHASGYAQQWNLTIQHELPWSILLETAYIANVGHQLGGQNVSINQIPLINGRGPASQSQALRPFPQFGNVTHTSPDWGNSTYHSMNIKLEKRYAAGMSFLGNYTWSKFLDDVHSGSELGGGSGYQHIGARNRDKGLSGSDIRHRLAWSTLYDLPFGRGRRVDIGNRFLDAVAGGWTLGGILETRTGVTWGVVELTNRLNAFSDSQRPNLLRDPSLSGNLSRGEKIDRWFDTSAFVAPGDGVLGNAGRTNGTGPAFFGLDASIQKLFRLTERFELNFRTDIVNLPNIPAFDLPNTQRGSGNFGKIAAILPGSTGREIQFSLRLSW